MQAILLFYQEKKLHNVKHSTFLTLFPPIEVMEKVMFELIIIGFITLTLSLLSGIPFVVIKPDSILLQKIFFSVVAWSTFAYLIVQRYSAGVRGKRAVTITLSGIIFLLLSYLGIKFFFEFIQ